MQDFLLVGLTTGFLLTTVIVAYASKKFFKSRKSPSESIGELETKILQIQQKEVDTKK